jgi:hypothetical protein
MTLKGGASSTYPHILSKRNLMASEKVQLSILCGSSAAFELEKATGLAGAADLSQFRGYCLGGRVRPGSTRGSALPPKSVAAAAVFRCAFEI